MPLQATSGAASYDAFGGGAVAGPPYIENVFSTWLYTGNGSTQTINNGIDLAGKGGLVWIKNRLATESVAWNHVLTDTNRGRQNNLFSNLTDAQSSSGSFGITSFNANGFSVDGGGGSSPSSGASNLNFSSAADYASWTFREQPKFFDVVTWTGNGVAGRQIPHSLDSVPGAILVKCTSEAHNWTVFHRGVSSPNTTFLTLNSNAAAVDFSPSCWNDTAPTSTVFTVDGSATVNRVDQTYVAYLFAHNAGGFGLTGTDNVISCGSYTGNGGNDLSGPTISLGYEPQWLMVKRATGGTGNWEIVDNMRGFPAWNASNQLLRANSAGAEAQSRFFVTTSTGFQVVNDSSLVNESGSRYIYIAIRRGPMRVPTTGTSVLGLNARTGTNANATVTGGAGVTDLAIIKNRTSGTVWLWASRLTTTGYLSSDNSDAEATANSTMLQANPWDVMDGIKVGTTSGITNGSTSNTFINYLIDRAPGFFDVVCYIGTSADRTVNHNLGVAPELMILKQRSGGAQSWPVYAAPLGATNVLILDFTQGSVAIGTIFNSTAPTSSVFSLGTNNSSNSSGSTYIAYLFASCPGVSKVGSYTGTGNNAPGAVVSTGFAGGPRFILIKRTDAAGNWWVFDTARGLAPFQPDKMLALNTTAAEVTSDEVDVYAGGFTVYSNNYGLNVSGGTYIFLAIA